MGAQQKRETLGNAPKGRRLIRGGRLLWACVTMLVALAFPFGLAGQAELRVTDGTGEPMPNVLVEFMAPADLLSWGTTDDDGRVALPADIWSAVQRLNLRHIGYETLVVPKAAVPVDGVLQLEPSAVQIEGLSVFAPSEVCSLADDPSGKALWSRAAERYADNTGRLDVEGQWLVGRGTVRETELFHRSTVRFTRGHYGWIGGSYAPGPAQRPLMESLVEETGYAWEPSPGRSGQRHLNWAYPELDGRHAYHFATPEFGELHRFSVVSRGDGWVTLAFCPVAEHDDRPSISGRVTLSEEGQFLSAQWRFHTTEPDEGAGGEVTFLGYDDPQVGGPHLLATQGMFFRHSGRSVPFPDLPRDYYREWRTYLGWTLFAPGN